MAKDFDSVVSGLSFFTSQTPLETQEKESIWRRWVPFMGRNKEERTDPEGKSLLNVITTSIKSGTGSSLSALRNAYEGTATAGRRLKYFFLFLFLGALFLCGSTLFLPMVLLMPQKFGLMFSLGGVCVHVALSYLKSSQWEYMKQLCGSTDSTLLSVAYFGSLFGTIWSAVVKGSYIGVIACTAVQGGAIVWFFFSLFPGGTTGLKKVMGYGLRLCCPFGSGDLSLPI
jgi:hypothetical protein